jgi:hypothetical protein
VSIFGNDGGGELAQGARHRPKMARRTSVAIRRRQPLDMVQAQAAGATDGFCGLCCATFARFAAALTRTAVAVPSILPLLTV